MMDIIFSAMTVILAKSQPLFAVLGLSSALPAVQLAVLAAVAIASIMLTIGILSLMVYGLKKLTKKGAVPVSQGDEDLEIPAEAPEPEEELDLVEIPDFNDNEVQELNKELEDIEKIPAIVAAQEKRDIARAAYTEIVEQGQAERNKLYADWRPKDRPERYIPSSTEKAAEQEAQKALNEYQKLYSEELNRIEYHKKREVQVKAKKAADLKKDKYENRKVINQLYDAEDNVKKLRNKLKEVKRIQITLNPKQNPKVKLDFFNNKLEIVKLEYRLLEANLEFRQAKLLVYISNNPDNNNAERTVLQVEFDAAQEALNQADIGYDLQVENARKDIEQAKKLFDRKLAQIKAKRAASAQQAPVVGAELPPVEAEEEPENKKPKNN